MKRLVFVACVIALAVVGYAAAGPYIALSQIRQGLTEQDTELLSENIDFPLLRENVKSQFSAGMMKSMASNDSGKDNMSKGFAAFGAMLAGKMVDTMVDGMVTPAGLAQMMGARNDGGSANGQAVLNGFDVQFVNLRRVEVRREGEASGVRLVLTRRGLTWRMTNIVLPPGTFDKKSTSDAAPASTYQKTWFDIRSDLPSGTDIWALKAWCDQPATMDYNPKLKAASAALAVNDGVAAPDAEKRIRKTVVDLSVTQINRACSEAPKS